MNKMTRRNFIRRNLGTVAAAIAPAIAVAQDRAAESPQNAVTVGFAKTDISPCIQSKTKFRKPLEAICASIAVKGTQAFLVALDLLEMSPPECLSIQQAVAAKLAVPADRILIHTTHTHCSPWGERESGQRITNLPDTLANCLSQARACAKSARIRTGATDVGKTLSVYRRGNAGPDLGFQTFWFGYKLRPGDDRPDASALVSEMKSRWLRQTPNYAAGADPVYFDGNVDSVVQCIRFEDAAGAPIGSIVRFSAHPHLTCACKDWLYDPDYPGVVRDVVEGQTAAPVMFLSGTCANLVPKENVRYVVDSSKVPPFPYMGPSSAFDPADDNELFAEVQRMGKAIAEAAAKAIENSPAEKLSSFNVAAGRFSVSLNPDIPASAEDRERLKAPLVAEYEAALKEQNPFPKLRVIADKLCRLEWAPSIAEQVLSKEDRGKGEVMLPLAAVVLNSNLLVFIHSEVPVETTWELRKVLPGRNVLTVGLTGGCIGYFPTAEMIEQGGYEGRATLIMKDAERKLRSDTAELLRGMGVA